MNRKQRRAAAHKERKLARKAGFPSSAVQPVSEPSAVAPGLMNEAFLNDVLLDVPEPGIGFPAFTSLAPKPKPPISPAKLAANRANAQLSTGPSIAGRAISSQNRTTHGLARHNGVFKLLATEDPAGFEALKQSLVAEHQPATETESILVNSMAESHWLAQRAENLQARCFDETTGEIADTKLFSLYMRYQSTHTRAFHKSLNDLLKLRAERRKAELGFEAHTRKQEEFRVKNEKHEMKKQSHYWDLLRKDAEACQQIAAITTQQIKATREDPGFEAQYEAELRKRGLEPGLGRTAAVA